MAKEITEAGQIVVYGGPTLTLRDSTIGNAVTSILVREGTSTARGWKLFDPTKAEFLNTKKQLVDGDFVLVNAKVLPMDFPIKIIALAPEIWEIDIPANSGSNPANFKYYLNKDKLAFTGFTLKDLSGNTVDGTCQFRLDGGNLLSAADFSAAILAANIPPAEVKSQVHDISVVVSITSNVAAVLSISTN